MKKRLALDRKDTILVRKENKSGIEKVVISQIHFEKKKYDREKLKVGTELMLESKKEYSTIYVHIKEITFIEKNMILIIVEH
ncbi:hypothetical protein [Carnobacterium divergens]|uniref:hypothetical protein n=1 Tax=Carnobacterium divergens TaxID=2748 RepID=UPI0039C9424D